MASANSPDPNDPSDAPRGLIVLWAVAAGMAMLILPLYLVSRAVRDDAARLESDLARIQGTLTAAPTPGPQTRDLMDTLAQAEGAKDEVEQARQTISASHVDWRAIMAAIGDFDLARLTLTSLVQDDKRIILEGQAVDESAVTAYARALRRSGLFSRVAVGSIRAIVAPTPTATGTPVEPSPTPTPSVTRAVTPTPTPAAGDKYEIDDFRPSDIILGRPQAHSFYPVHDVDTVRFLAKAGRYYRVSTSNLPPGVDTLVTVNVAGVIHANDDRAPGDLSSECVFRVAAGHDVHAVVKVTNRGQYGPDSSYRISVEEVVATPTPTSAPLPPVATPPDAFPTYAPPTPTPDLRDEYEPDDGADEAPIIAVDETQTHNLYPAGDVDRVTFGVKTGRLYALGTSNLAVGTDTEIEVEVNGVVCEETAYYRCENDDLAPGFLESEVRFVPDKDGTAVATIRKGTSGQYGADKTYDLTLSLLSIQVDAYEPDDAFPKPIAIGEPQTHNFYPGEDIDYPGGDVDNVKFLAKNTHHYRVTTDQPGPGFPVDTVLTVKVDGATYANDDRSSSDLNSRVDFTVTTGYDVIAFAKVTNRGLYGPDKVYEITVDCIECAATPTPSSSSSSSRRRPGGTARLIAGLGARDPRPRSQTAAERALVPPSSSMDRKREISDALESAAVEFVIVLELR